MDPNKKIFNSMKYVTMLSQLGLSVIIPPLVCIWLSLWLKEKFNFGDWVVLVGIFLGIASGITSLINYLKVFVKDAKENQQEYQDKFKE